MAKLDHQSIRATLIPQLQPGEELVHAAYGVRPPGVLFILMVAVLTVGLGGLLAGVVAQIAGKHYLVGVTRTRLILLRISSFGHQPLECVSHPLGAMASARTQTGVIFVRIELPKGSNPSYVKFHRAAFSGNREEAIGIGRMLEAGSSGQVAGYSFGAAPVGTSLGAASSLLRIPYASVPAGVRPVVAAASRGDTGTPYVRLAPIGTLGPALVALSVAAFAGAIGVWRLGIVEAGRGFSPSWGAALFLCVAATALCFALFRALRLAGSRLKPAVLLSPALLLRTGADGDPLEVVPLSSLESARQLPKEVLVLGARGAPIMTLKGLRSQAGLITDAIARQRQTGPQGLSELDWASDLPSAGAASGHGGRTMTLLALAVGPVLGLVASLVVYVGGVVVADASNFDRMHVSRDADSASLYLDYTESTRDPLGLVSLLTSREDRRREAEVLLDRFTFEEALRQKRLTPLRTYLYLTTVSQGRRLLGRHVPQAEQAIQGLYADKAQQYQQTALANGASLSVILGVKEILAWLGRDARSADVELVLVQPNQAEVTRVVRQRVTSARVADVGEVFTAGLNARREKELTQALHAALGKYFTSEELELTKVPQPGRPRVTVHSSLAPSGSVYFRDAEAHLPPVERKAYPGVQLLFEFKLQTPDVRGALGQGHGLSDRARPPPRFTVQSSKGFAPSDGAVYSIMVETAFSDFRDKMARGLGFVPPPTKAFSMADWERNRVGAKQPDEGPR